MRPLTRWRIRAPRLPERLTENAPPDEAFHLPGADALSAFADLLGAPPEGGADDAQAVQEADFPLPAAIPGDVGGAVELTYALDFGALCADDAELTLELVRGRGRVLADDVPLCAFQNPKDGLVRVPLAHALHAGRRQTLRLCFDASRPAGVLGPVCLHLTTRARLRDIALWPDAQTKTVRLRAAISAMETGRFVLRARAACAGEALPVHDLPVSLTAGEPQTVEMTLPLPGKPFIPGQPADGPSLRVQLLTPGRHGALCDELTLLCGYSGAPAKYDSPLLPAECLDPDALLARIGRLCLPGVRLDVPAPDAFYRAMTLSGVSVLHPFATQALRERLARHACVVFGDAPLPRMRSLPAHPARGRHARRAASRGRRARSGRAKPEHRRRAAVASRRPHPAAGRGRAAGALFRRALPARRLAGRGCFRRPANRACADARRRSAPVRRVVRGFGLQRVGQRVRRCAGRGRRADRPRVARG